MNKKRLKKEKILRLNSTSDVQICIKAGGEVHPCEKKIVCAFLVEHCFQCTFNYITLLSHCKGC